MTLRYTNLSCVVLSECEGLFTPAFRLASRILYAPCLMNTQDGCCQLSETHTEDIYFSLALFDDRSLGLHYSNSPGDNTRNAGC